jgi:hypothetical protein
MQTFLLLLVVSCVLLTATEAFAGRMRSMRGQMSMMARKPIIAGNWKMNTDLEVRFADICMYCPFDIYALH